MKDVSGAAAPFPELEPYPFQESLGFLLARLKGRITAVLDEELLAAAMDITHAQWVVLVRIANGMDSCVEIARSVGHDSGAVTRMLDRLEEKQLILRERSAEDRRLVSIRLTPQGMALYPQLLVVGRRMQARMCEGIPAGEIDHFRDMLYRMLANLGITEVKP